MQNSSPQFTRHDSSDDLRYSVFEAFLELGAFEQDSQLLEWVFSDESADSSSSTYARPVGARESKYFERFDSAFIPPNLDEDQNTGMLQTFKSFCSKPRARRATNVGPALPLARKQSPFASKSPGALRIGIKKERSASDPSPARRRVSQSIPTASFRPRPRSSHVPSTLWW